MSAPADTGTLHLLEEEPTLDHLLDPDDSATRDGPHLLQLLNIGPFVMAYCTCGNWASPWLRIDPDLRHPGVRSEIRHLTATYRIHVKDQRTRDSRPALEEV
jgi:hypothetical protein